MHRGTQSPKGLAANIDWIRTTFPSSLVKSVSPPKCPDPPAGWSNLACPKECNGLASGYASMIPI
jgi:hypothetical protein